MWDDEDDDGVEEREMVFEGVREMRETVEKMMIFVKKIIFVLFIISVEKMMRLGKYVYLLKYKF